MLGSDNEVKALVRKLYGRLQTVERQHQQMLDKYEEFVRASESRPRSITEEIDSIPGRRIFYTMVQRQVFDATQAGLRFNALTFTVSQDGPYIMTHYPFVSWFVSLPAAATDFGIWRPVSSWPLPDQVDDTDLIDLSYEFSDGGSQRAFQDNAVPPLFSRPDALQPLPVPTLFAPNTTITFLPTYQRIRFGGATPATQGTLVVALPGYRIVNL